MTEHLSRHQLEQLIAGERESGPRASTRAELQARSHVLGCDVCTTRKRSIETARARFLAVRPADDFVRTTLERAANAPVPPALEGGLRARAARWAVGGAALAAAVTALILILAPREHAARDGIRLKGPPALEVLVKRGEHATPIQDGDALARGDRLGFVYTLSEPRHLLLLGVDDHGVITRYFPSEGAAPALAAGARVQLPLGVQLDERRGEERLIALFAPAPPDEATARRALADAFERAQREGRGLAALERVDLPAQQASIWFRKP